MPQQVANAATKLILTSVYWLFLSNPIGAGVAKVKEKRERERGGGTRRKCVCVCVGGGGGDMRAIIIISKSIQIKVIPLYSQVWSNKILRPCPFLSTAQEHRHRHKTKVLIWDLTCVHRGVRRVSAALRERK